MKFENLHPAEEKYMFKISDEMVDFAEKHDKAMHG
ncbi:endo-1,4-beta-xylanase [Gracilibacillus boraciitolerans]|nr:endo-1,4-beta-xylanase [Gracilibacillus boraciitolerans]